MKKVTKRLLALLLASAMVFGLAACGGKESESTETPAVEDTANETENAETDLYAEHVTLTYCFPDAMLSLIHI